MILKPDGVPQAVDTSDDWQIPMAPPDQVATSDPNPTAATVEAIEQRLRFTGSGGEYFRIWAVNRTLTVLTLGLYSAWAKVRRLQ